jgi:LmbE family N-acetylglucosaminyl deacetylase
VNRLVLSPHPDDAVWSVGGCLAEWAARGDRVVVLTAFDGDPPPGPAPVGWRAVADPAVRRAEDARARGCLGVAGVSLGLSDAALRRSGGRPSYPSRLSLFGPPADADEDLLAPIAAAAHDLLDRLGAGTRLYAPLAAGRHVDHQLARAAVADDVPPATITWYEDFPYRLARRDVVGLRPQYEPVRLGDWLAAAACYPSQAGALLGGVEPLARALCERAVAHGGAAGREYATRLWVPG